MNGIDIFKDKKHIISLIIIIILLIGSYLLIKKNNENFFTEPTLPPPPTLNGVTMINIKNDKATDFIYPSGPNIGKSAGKPLQISQLAVYTMINGVETNIAPLGRATASSFPDEKHKPKVAIDGTLKSRSDAEGIFHNSGGGNNEWWNLKLNKPYDIHKVVFYNRGDCCQIRAKGVEVQFFDDSSTIIPIFSSTLSDALEQTIQFPISTNSLTDSLQNSYDLLNKSRFNTLDNYDRINSLDKRIHKIKKQLSINTANSKKLSGGLNFY